VARATLEAGVGWVLVSDSSRYLDVLRREFPDRLVAWACVNNEEIGNLQAEMALRFLPGGGKVLVLEGPTATSTTIQRRRGLENRLRGSRVQPSKTVSADWKCAGAERATETWLRLVGNAAVRPDLVISQNDEMAEGALQALHANRPDWGKLRAIGCDGLPGSGQRLVREGVLAATIVTPPATGAGVDLVVKSMRGEQVPPGLSIRVRPYPALEELAS
jgi:inositol transport system substrate-binding protein